MGTLAELRRTVSPQVLHASVTPLASIFGSGFLIIVPLLERSMGSLAVIGVVAICAVAWFVGSAIRHNIVAIVALALLLAAIALLAQPVS